MIDKFLMTAIANKGRFYMTTLLGTLPIILSTLAHTLLLASIIDAVFLKQASLTDQLPYLALLLLSFILKPYFNYLHERRGRLSASLAKENLRTRLTKALYTKPQQDDDEKTTGLYATLASEGIESTDAYYAEFVPQIFLMTLNTLGLLAIAFYLDWISALIMLITAPLIPLFMMLIGKTAEGVNLRQWDSLKRMNGHLLDLLRGIQTLRAFTMDIKQIDSVSQTSESFRKKTLEVLRLTFLSAFALELTATLSTAMIAVSLGVRLLYGQIPFYNALAILLLAPEYYLPLRQLGLKYHAAMNAKGISKQLKPLFEASEATEDTSVKVTIEPTDLLDQFSQGTDAITIHRLSFAYGNYPVLSGLSAQIKHNEATAITGISGSGKTTLLKLIAGELSAQSGDILLGNTSSAHLTYETRADLIAYVPQHPRIFKGSILENLRLGNPKAPLADVEAACQLTGFHAVLNRLPSGLETLLGDGVQSLSGGETQLLALTRAVIRQTPILLLDEPSSALDPLSEELLASALKKLANQKTLVIAAHREATIQLCPNRIQLQREVAPC